MQTHSCERAPLAALVNNPRNARTHSRRQIRQIARSIQEFGFTNPILVDENMTILAGHGRAAAARELGLTDVPILQLKHMSEAQKRAYVIADNKLALNAGWDKDLLAIELQELIALEFDFAPTGFEVAEIDLLLSDAEAAATQSATGPEDEIPALCEQAVSKPGQVWTLGRHRLLCGDARDGAGYARLMQGERADVVFTDPPYNVKIEGHARVAKGHREFAMAAGEMSREAFTAFLTETLGQTAGWCRNGAIAFVCMDWRHLPEMLDAGAKAFDELKNVCVWCKRNGGMGTLYRSQHEFVFVFKKGAGPHCNNVELGRFGRNRTNVWQYAGANGFGAGRAETLAMHPTVKPVALVEDALKDVSKRSDVALDPFAGSGATLIAAERCGRRARVIELDPAYCDLIVRRYQGYTGKDARCESTNLTFEEASEAAMEKEAAHV